MDTNEVSLQVVKNNGIISKIVSFFKNIFNSSNDKSKNIEDNKKNSFMKQIKFEEDPDKELLLKIQDELEKIGINEENAIQLTKDLSDSQKQKLENLYKEQIEQYERETQSYKEQIINIKKQLA